MTLDLTNLRNTFKAIYNIDLIKENEKIVINTIRMFVQLKINMDTEYAIPVNNNPYSFIQEYNTYFNNLEKHVQFNENMEPIYIKEPFLNKYKEELLLSLNPNNFKDIKYGRTEFYFLYYKEIIKSVEVVFYKENVLYNATMTTNQKRISLCNKYAHFFLDAELLEEFVLLKEQLSTIRSIFSPNFKPLNTILLNGYLRGTAKVREFQLEKNNIEKYFSNQKIEFPELIEYYSNLFDRHGISEQVKTTSIKFLLYFIDKNINERKKNEVK